MAIVFLGGGAVAFSASAISPALPSGTFQNGDLFIGVGEATGSQPFVSPDAWPHVPGSPVNVDTSTRLTVLYRRWSDGDTALSWGDPGDHGIGWIGAWRGVRPIGNPWDASPQASQETVLDTSAAWPTLTTTVDNCLLLFIIATGRDANSTTNLGAVTGGTGLTAVTERLDTWKNVGSGGGIGLVEALKATAGTIGSPVATMGSTDAKAFMTLALAPAGAPTVPVVSIGEDSWAVVNGTFGRVAVEDDTGDPITAREWKIMSGPADAGNVVGTEVMSTWTPTATGSYVVRYTATNGIGASFDEINLEVGGLIEGPQNSITNVSRR